MAEHRETIREEEVPPDTQPIQLVADFGTVSDWSGPLPTREIRLSNSQAQVMKGTVRSTLPWLEVTPESFTCPPGQEIVLTVRLTKKAAWLRSKNCDVADALVIESGDRKHLVRATLKEVWVTPPKAREEGVVVWRGERLPVKKWLTRKIPVKYAHLGEALKAQMIEGDEVWEFRSPPESWRGFYGRAGVALVRNGEVVDIVVGSMN